MDTSKPGKGWRETNQSEQSGAKVGKPHPPGPSFRRVEGLVRLSSTAMRSACAVLLLCLLGCGGVKREELSAQYVAALCDHFARCGVVVDAPLCVKLLTARQAVEFDDDRFNAAIAAKRMRYDEGRAASCMDAIKKRVCDDVESESVRVCSLIFGGLRKEGEDCDQDECAPGLYCSAEVDAVCPGECLPQVKEGGAASRDVQCAEGLQLVGEACLKGGVEGVACADSESCASGFFCKGGACTKLREANAECSDTDLCNSYFDCVNGRCLAPSGEGGACGPEGSSSCKGGLFCENATRVCTVLRGEGGACASSAICAPELGCARTGTGTQAQGTCKAPVGAGQSCATDVCSTGLFCDATVTNQCQRIRKAGEACATSNDCQSTRCVNRVCAETSVCG
jgi:hypothetical protein